MSLGLRIAVNMQPVLGASGEPTFQATLPMAVLFEKSLDAAHVERERELLQGKYARLVKALSELRQKLKQGRAIDNWLFGDAIVKFEQETADTLLFVDHLTKHLSRDLEYGKSMIDLCRRFRMHLPDKTQIDPTLPFAAYHRSGFDPQRAQRFSATK